MAGTAGARRDNMRGRLPPNPGIGPAMASRAIGAANCNTGRRMAECPAYKTPCAWRCRNNMATCAITLCGREMIRRFGDNATNKRLAGRVAGGTPAGNPTMVHQCPGEGDRGLMTGVARARGRHVIGRFRKRSHPGICTTTVACGAARRDAGMVHQRSRPKPPGGMAIFTA